MKSFEYYFEQWEQNNKIIDKDQNITTKTNLKTKKNQDQPVIDLHGLTCKQAEIELKKFIRENKSKSKKVKIKIIHGAGNHSKGIPKLKQMVREILQGNPLIESFRPGKIEEGSKGVTIAILKQK